MPTDRPVVTVGTCQLWMCGACKCRAGCAGWNGSLQRIQLAHHFPHWSLKFFFVPSRSVILKRKRTVSDHSLVSEGLREAIYSYLQMTEAGENSCWDTWGKTAEWDCNSSAAAWGSHWKRPSTRPSAVFRDCPGIARGLRHYAVWRYAVLQTIWAGGLLLWMCVQRGIQRSFEKCVLIWLRNIECIF